jgi:transcription antitermination protein NusB
MRARTSGASRTPVRDLVALTLENTRQYMANRHLSRSIVMQSLFEWDFRNAGDEAVEEVIVRNAREFAPGMGDFSYVKELSKNVIAKRPELDAIIEKAAPEWPIQKISIVDRNILRIGLYELIFVDKAEVPSKVAINEAIELAKTFGGENSAKFVNGVLGAVYKEMGEPGKDEGGLRRDLRRKKIDPSKLPQKRLCGAVVYARHNNEVYLAFVHDIFGRWTLSKGSLLENEPEEEGTVRKIKEEIGADVSIKEKLGDNEYIASDQNQKEGKIRKHVSYFLAEAPYTELTLAETGGLDDVRWFKLDEIETLNLYDDILPIITNEIQLLATKYAHSN